MRDAIHGGIASVVSVNILVKCIGNNSENFDDKGFQCLRNEVLDRRKEETIKSIILYGQHHLLKAFRPFFPSPITTTPSEHDCMSAAR